MTAMMDMSLDDIIKLKKTNSTVSGGFKKRGRGNGRFTIGSRRRNIGGGGGGGGVGGETTGAIRTSRFRSRAKPYPVQRSTAKMDLEPTGNEQNIEGMWSHDRFIDDEGDEGFEEDNEGGRKAIRRTGARFGQSFKRRNSWKSSSSSPSSLPAGTRVIVTGLNYDVLDDDLTEIFSKEGEVKYAAVRFDRSGRSTGKGDVIFARYSDAERAVASLDSIELNDQIIRVRIAPNTNSNSNNSANVLISAASAAAASASASAPRRVMRTNNSPTFTITSNQEAGQRRVQLGGRPNRRLSTRSRLILH